MGSMDLSDWWMQFCKGDLLLCPKDDALVALSIDAHAKLYRFVCPHCGEATAWFGVAGMEPRAHAAQDRLPL